VLALVKLAHDEVQQRFGVALEREIVLVPQDEPADA